MPGDGWRSTKLEKTGLLASSSNAGNVAPAASALTDDL
jgi:hypothetical protein